MDDLFRCHVGQVRAVVTSRIPDSSDVDDLVQATLMRAYLGLGRFRQESSFGTWLTRIALNVCSNHRRNQKAGMRGLMVPLGQDETVGTWACCHPDQEYRAWLGELRKTIEQAMASLPLRYQDVLRRYHFKDHDVERICQDLQIPLGTVKTWLHRGRLQLRESLQQDLLGC